MLELALTTHDLLGLHTGEAAQRIAIIEGDRTYSYAEVQRQVDAVAGRLQSLGVGRGDRVVVHLRKSVNEVVGLFACWRIGAVAVNVNTHWTVDQLQYVVEDCGARVLLVDARRAAACGPIESALVVGGPVDRPGFSPWPDSGGTVEERHLLDIDDAAILYTSGSTGQPKGVVLSHTNLLVGARSVARYLDIGPDERLMGLLPLSFDYGLNQLLTAFLRGATLVQQAVVMPSAVVKTLVEQRVTGLAAVPPAWTQITRYLERVPTELPHLRYVTNSGGKVPEPILALMPRVFPGVRIHLMYGLTESFRSTSLPPSRYAAKPGSMGTAVPNAEVHVVVAGRGVADVDEPGELIHRGSFISKGYWGRPEETAAKIRPCPELADRFGDEKVVWSGDLVRRDADGDLWFVGRADGMIKSMGFRLSPTEVEDHVYASGLVREAVAFGIPDPLAGQAVVVAVHHPEDEVDVDGVMKHCRSAMPHYMLPRRIHVWEQPMPRTASGKIAVPQVVERTLAEITADRGTQ
jgi:acyl-CoA synthetase (AMP-forming)/AMP-acid ligase II